MVVNAMCGVAYAQHHRLNRTEKTYFRQIEPEATQSLEINGWQNIYILFSF